MTGDKSLGKRRYEDVVKFDAEQIWNPAAVARALWYARDGIRDGGLLVEGEDGAVKLVRGSAMKKALEHNKTAGVPRIIRRVAADRTPTENACMVLLQNPGALTPEDEDNLDRVLDDYVTAVQEEAEPDVQELRKQLARRFNNWIAKSAVGEAGFRPFLEAGVVQALGDTVVSAVDRQVATRALIEAAFPTELQRLRDRRLAPVFAHIRALDSAALCLSGGGIRSSSFALGIMQGLAKHNLLGKFDFLSTVSGGGLSGGWLSAWMEREGAVAVHKALRSSASGERADPQASSGSGSGDVGASPTLEPEAQPLRALRQFSNWLAPGSMASADGWTVMAILGRNLLLNWLVLLPLLAAVVMTPRLLQALLQWEYEEPTGWTLHMLGQSAHLPVKWFIHIGIALGLLGMVVSAAFLLAARRGHKSVATRVMGRPTQARFAYQFLLPRVLGAVVLTFTFYLAAAWDRQDPSLRLARSFWIQVAGWFAALVVISTVLGLIEKDKGKADRLSLRRILSVLISAGLGYVLPFVLLLGSVGNWTHELTVIVAPAVLLVGSVGANFLYTGLTSDDATDETREWEARGNAYLLVASLGWMSASALVLYGPRLITDLWNALALVGVTGVLGKLALTLGKKSDSGKEGEESAGDKAGSIVAALVAPLVVAGIVIGLAAANEGAIKALCRRGVLNSTADYSCKPVGVPSLARLAADATRNDSTFTVLLDSLHTNVEKSSPNQLPDIAPLASLRRLDVLSGTSRVAFLNWANETGRLLALREDMVPQRLDSLERSVEKDLQRFSFTLGRALWQLDQSPNVRVGAEWVAQATHTVAALKADSLARAEAILELERLAEAPLRKVSDRHLSFASPPVHTDQASPQSVLALLLLLLGFGYVVSRWVNTNTFSLHAFWRARTVRAFLGTTRPPGARFPNPLTGFDSDDDLPLSDLWPADPSVAEMAYSVSQEKGQPPHRSERVPPMHVFNVTLNLAATRKLEWQQRQAESMTLSPLHGGSAHTGYRRMTSRDSRAAYGGDEGVSLGTAMAISGAFVSPSMGSYNFALSGFLLALFNARVGRWLGNPGAPGSGDWVGPEHRRANKDAPWQRAAPPDRVGPILKEMFGETDDSSEYVYLSDGGHFENLALYEMVLRRNRFILVSDAGGDPDYTFGDLGNAIRKIRIDLGVPITFDHGVEIHGRENTGTMQRGHDRGAYWATARIKYSEVDMPYGQSNPDDYDGVLVYVKPVTYLREDRDVVDYANQHPAFPHEANQSFSEAQFESYRALGAYIIDQFVQHPEKNGWPRVKRSRAGSLLSMDWAEGNRV